MGRMKPGEESGTWLGGVSTQHLACMESPPKMNDDSKAREISVKSQPVCRSRRHYSDHPRNKSKPVVFTKSCLILQDMVS